jgi:hypothetical protein
VLKGNHGSSFDYIGSLNDKEDDKEDEEKEEKEEDASTNI